MDSPFKSLRRAAGMTQQGLADSAEISRQAIATMEIGMYDIIPERANRALATACRAAGVDTRRFIVQSSLNRSMDLWKTEHRREQDLEQWPAMSLKEIIAKYPNPRAFCAALCIPTAALHNALYREIAMPHVIVNALSEAGYQHLEGIR